MKRERSGAARLRLEVFHHLFASIAEEMGVALARSAFSPNIKERRDFSCALFDDEGRMVSQAAHLPVHLGSTPACVRAAIEHVHMDAGDCVILNDPFQGGTHLPDVTLVSPVFLPEDDRPRFYCANRAHHADIGGVHPGSMAPVPDVHGEGLRIPPMKIVRAGRLERELFGLFLCNMRVPEEREGDLLAQWSANRIGVERLIEMAREHGTQRVVESAQGLLDWSEELTRAELRALPRGTFAFEDELETPTRDGGRNARIHLTVRTGAKKTVFDFRGTDEQVQGPVNTTRAVCVSSVFYVLRLLLDPSAPTNDGMLRPVEILTEPGTIVDAIYPAAVAAGNVETSQRLVDVLLGALSKALPERIPAASAGTMSNLTFGTVSTMPGGSFTYYETIGGGAGAGPDGAGAHALQTHMTNTRNTPIEAFENELPVRVEEYTVRRGSGGDGAVRGGDGIRKRLSFLRGVRIAWIAERQVRGPWGLGGGAAGDPGRASVRRPGSDVDEALSGKAALELPAGAELTVETPGGGGFGAPS